MLLLKQLFTSFKACCSIVKSFRRQARNKKKFSKVKKVRNVGLLCSILDVRPDVLEFGEDLGEETRLRVDPEHRLRQLVDDLDATVPELLLVRLDEERLQRVADLIAHVAENNYCDGVKSGYVML
jgi:hypothetical protein